VGAVAGHVRRAHLLHVLGVQDHDPDVAHQPREDEGDEGPAERAAKLVGGLAEDEARPAHAATVERTRAWW